jgi:hypothetical protein
MSRISYNVPGIQQGSSNTCWLACLRMLTAFQVQVGRQVNAMAAALVTESAVTRYERLDRALDPSAFESMATSFGLSALHVPGLTRALRGSELADPLAAYDVLQRRGPFTIGGILPSRSAHAIVICGGSNDGDYDVQFIDPRYGNVRHASYTTLRTGFPPDGGALFVY